MPTDATSVKPSRAPVEPSIFGGRSRPRRRRTATGDQRLPAAAALMVFASGSGYGTTRGGGDQRPHAPLTLRLPDERGAAAGGRKSVRRGNGLADPTS